MLACQRDFPCGLILYTLYLEVYRSFTTALRVMQFAGLLTEVSSTTGILLDPVYTLKAVKGMLEEMAHRPERFKGRRVLFVHTGTLEGGTT